MRICSFCGIEENRVDILLIGPNVAICNACVEACRDPLDGSLHAQLAVDSESVSERISADLKWGPLNRGAAIRAKFCCEYCGRRFLRSLDDYYSWQMDHIVPGGGDSLENYALACQTCNHLKHFYMPKGETREERLLDAAREVKVRRAKKGAELARLRELLGLPQLIAS